MTAGGCRSFSFVPRKTARRYGEAEVPHRPKLKPATAPPVGTPDQVEAWRLRLREATAANAVNQKNHKRGRGWG